jgi:hypothetical protein
MGACKLPRFGIADNAFSWPIFAAREAMRSIHTFASGAIRFPLFGRFPERCTIFSK